MNTIKTKAEKIRDIIVRLNPDHPENRASDKVKAHLREIEMWIDAWIIGDLEDIYKLELKKTKAFRDRADK